MTENVMQWVHKTVEYYKPVGPVLEVGSMNINGSVREFFPDMEYIGMDMREGYGVDLVADVLKHHFADGQFGTIITTEMLEHCTEPWTAVDRMSRWIAPGGHLIVTVPFMFDIHDYPSDYWRFTREGLRYLFTHAGLQTIIATTDKSHSYGLARKN